MALPLLSDFSTKTIISGTDIQNEHENIASKFNGNIVDADVNANANLSLGKLAGRYQYTHLFWHIDTSAGIAPGYLSGGGPIVIPEVTGGTAWDLVQISWIANDTGTANASYRFDNGNYIAGSWDIATGNRSSTSTYTLTSQGASQGNQGVQTVSGFTLGLESTPLALRPYCVSAGTAWGGGAGDYLKFTVTLRRDIQAA